MLIVWEALTLVHSHRLNTQNAQSSSFEILIWVCTSEQSVYLLYVNVYGMIVRGGFLPQDFYNRQKVVIKGVHTNASLALSLKREQQAYGGAVYERTVYVLQGVAVFLPP